VTMGRIGPNREATGMSPQASSTRPPTTLPNPMAPTQTRTPVADQVVSRHSSNVNVTPASHIVGVGGIVASTHSFGATARAWNTGRLGIQFGLTRDSMTSAAASGRVTSMQFEPGVVYGLLDHISDYVWIRPYVGSAVSFSHQTLSSTSEALPPTSDNGLGFTIFGGTELTFASAPRFGLSADLGYRRFPTPFPGFDAAPLRVSIAGHWYIK
jgi:hypothetical protein